MSQQQRKQNLFGIQDWQNIYQTFRDADFKSYDYETLRKSMIDFLKIYNPENFNDYINSSEYVALIDLIAFMGQSLSFRMDLNARENYLETARRRDNVLRLAKLINYEPKRNLVANGLLKIISVRTDEQVRDILGNNLNNVTVNWNDVNNSNWAEQWNSVLNAAITSSQRVGRPGNTTQIDGIVHSEYSIDLTEEGTPPFRYNSIVDNTSMDFEIINPTISSGNSIEEHGNNGTLSFNLLYRDDNRGFSSNNTGYFLKFKQGTLFSEQITITESLPNRQVNLNSAGINNDDIWVYQQNSDGTLVEWKKVDSVNGSTLNYNTQSANKKVFSAASRADDAVTLIFGDGVFSEIPVGNFVVYYRVGNGLNYRINPSEMSNISIDIPYLSKNNRVQILTLTGNLLYTVANSAARETIADIKTKAPQNFYVQNRMVNGQDYNSFPFTKYNNILKIKSVNRTSSGISRYLDVIDNTGRYSSTNIVCDDGFIYQDTAEAQYSFTFSTRDDVVEAVNTIVIPSINDEGIRAFFYKNYDTVSDLVDFQWNLVLADNDVSSGYISKNGTLITTTDSDFSNKFRVGAVLKFQAPPFQIFDYDNKLVTYTGSAKANQKDAIFATVRTISYLGRGNQVGDTDTTRGRDTIGVGAIVLSEYVPTGALLTEILPTYDPNLSADIQKQLIDALMQKKTVALRFKSGSDIVDSVGDWQLIETSTVGNFVENSSTDWLMRFVNTANSYTITQRSIKYYFGSERQTRFFYDSKVKIYDPLSGKLLKDRITFLNTNSLPTGNVNLGYTNDINIGVSGVVIESDGFVDDTKIQVTFADKDSDGSPDQPFFYSDIVGTNVNTVDTLVFFVNDQTNSGSSMKVLSKGTVKIAGSVTALNNNIYQYSNGDIVYTLAEQAFYEIFRTADSVSKTLVTDDYTVRNGRQSIKFQYRHNAPSDRRIDPSPSNIIDVYILEKNYADDYIAWTRDYAGTVQQPVEPTPESLRNDFNELENYRMISDLMIYSPAKFKPLFGSKAEPNLRAKFLVVKNPNVFVSDSEVKSQLITKINEYFDLENWDFGETFYFSELAAYLHNEMYSIISSVHLVPTSTDQTYGDLQQIRCLPNEILISAATVLDVDVVTNLTTVKLRAGN